MPRVMMVDQNRWWSWTIAGAAAIAILTVLYVFPPEHSRFYPRCVFNALTGWQCPGCGGLRAAHQLLHGNVAASWHLNPLVVMGVAGGTAWLAAQAFGRWSRRDLLKPLWRPWLFWVGLGGVVLFAVARNLNLGG